MLTGRDSPAENGDDGAPRAAVAGRVGGGAGLMGVAGAALAVVVLALATGTGSIILDSFASGWTQALWFAAVPAGAALIAMATARVTVSRFLARAA